MKKKKKVPTFLFTDSSFCHRLLMIVRRNGCEKKNGRQKKRKRSKRRVKNRALLLKGRVRHPAVQSIQMP